MSDPYLVEGHEVRLGMSVGVAMSNAQMTADALLVRADEALYRVKRHGRGGTEVAVPD